ncbi:DHA2 family efflux MFS transporter permease subunit [Paenibacillus silviterrae]|uniref:DHA2 family efflux MFS transporter permease subunit n=1 Tax=Paenibacillus silviterrae TaxID=3242194 RepID=UPI002542C4CF|nr:DHA2 family efflux MFS transporter permease subunit [Paenibacillus chinjuensis]
MLILIMGAFLSTLNQTIMSVAIPKLMNAFTIPAATAQWLTTGYMLVNGILIPITAYLMRRFTTRQLFLTSMITFLAGTVISAIATLFPVLLAGRLIQASGAGMIMPLLTQVVLTMYPKEKRGAAMGMVGFAVIFAPALGPTIAGYILEAYSWKAIFYGMFPLAAIVVLAGYIYLRNVSEPIKLRIDICSVILSTISFGTLLYGFSLAGNKGWSNSEVMISISVGIIALGIFIWRQLSSTSPLLDLNVFKIKMYSLTTVINIAVTMVMYADMILLPLYLQNARGFTALEAGFLLLPGALIMGLLMPVTGKWFDRFGAKWLAIAGLSITIVTTAGFVQLTDSTSYLYLLLMSTGRRIGMALLMMPVQTAGLNQLPSSLHAHGTAITNTIRQVSGAIGTSLLVTIMSAQTKVHLNEMTSGLEVKDISQAHLMIQASIEGINDAYLVIIGIGTLGLLLSFFIKRSETAVKPLGDVKPLPHRS